MSRSYKFIIPTSITISFVLSIIYLVDFNLFAYSLDDDKLINSSTLTGDNVSSINDDQSMTVPNKCEELNTKAAASIAIETSETIYNPDQNILVDLYVYDENGCKISYLVTLLITETNFPSKVIYKQSFFSSLDELDTGFTSEQAMAINEIGTYNISAYVSSDKGTINAWKIIEIREIFSSKQAIMLYISIIFFSGLIFLILKSNKSHIFNEIMRFVLISGIAFSVLSSFMFINEEMGGFSPVGIVKKPPPASEIIGEDQNMILGENTLGDGEWVINIGGQPPDYIQGIQIPISVFIFGLSGGYLRYLYKTSKIRHNYSGLEGKDNERLLLFYNSLEDISILFLAPLLAIAVWFLLDLAGIKGQDAKHTIAVTSFTVGLITEEVIQALIRYTSSVLKIKENTSKDQTK